MGPGMRYYMLGLALAQLLVSPAAAEDAPPPANEPAAAVSAGLAAPPDGQRLVLLLKSDKIIVGQVRKAPGGYHLEKNGGTVFFPEDQVAFVAPTVRAVFEYKLSRIPSYDVEQHFRLYQWCLASSLFDEAEVELKRILEVDPGNAKATRALASLERRKNPPTSARSGEKTIARAIPAAPSDVIDSFVSGHGRKTFEKYVAIEKVLLNRCATAACHGTSRHPGEFRLFRRSEGEHYSQRLTAHNLQAVLKFVDLEEPQRSRILALAIEPHGGVSIPPLGGINDPKYKELRDWVYNVSQKWSLDDEIIAKVKELEQAPTVDPSLDEIALDRWESATRMKYRRPNSPGLEGGSDVSDPPRGFGAAADDSVDAPPASRAVAGPSAKSKNAPPSGPRREAAPRPPLRPSNQGQRGPGGPEAIDGNEPGTDPLDPSVFNAGLDPMNAKSGGRSPEPGGASPAAADATPPAAEIEPGGFVRPPEQGAQLPKEVDIPSGRDGKLFKAAPFPFNLRFRRTPPPPLFPPR